MSATPVLCMDRSWILVGMMGSGKSAVGRSLAAASGRKFEDTDLMLQHRFGRPIDQIFSYYGEEAFRGHETSVLKGLEPGLVVLATGGGIVAREANWTEMRRLGTTVFLNASEATLLERLGQSKKRRPLLQTDAWQERVSDLLIVRRELYERADLAVEVDGLSVSDAAAKVLVALSGQAI